ncbi:hypothetical protein GCM10027443_06700 [Pontibacter brevis]
MTEKTPYNGTSSGTENSTAQVQPDVRQDLSCLLQILESAPDAYLILSPDLIIRMATDAYLAATFSRREEIIGKSLFDVFPENPAMPESNAVKNLKASFDRVLSSKKPDTMVVQQYDVPRPSHPEGGVEQKYWSPLNTPVLNAAGEIAYIIHKVSDVTELVKSQGKVEKLNYQHHVLQAALEQLHNTKQKLEEEQRRLEETQTLGHIGSFEAAYPYENIRWSAELYRIHGYEPQQEKITYEKYAALIHPDDREAYERAIAAFYTEQKELDHICRIIRKDGAVRVLHIRGKIEFVGMGSPQKVNGTVQDITEQVKAQQKIRESEMLLREAEQVGRVGSYYGDVATLTFRFSEGMYRLLGLEPDSFAPTLDIIDAASHPDDVPVVRQVLEQAIRNKQPYEYYRRVYLPDGEMRYMHSSGKVKCDSEGNAQAFIGIVQDITERKLIEEKIRQSELHFRTLLDNTPDIITRWDKDRRLIFNNNAFEAATGMSVSFLYLKGNSQAEQPETCSMSWKEKLSLVFETGETQDYNHSCELPNGRAYYYSRLVPESSEDGSIQSVLVIARDVSALKKLEQENLQLRLNQQKELLLAIMETQETERRRIAEALHNGIGQLLYGAKLNLDQLTREEVTQDKHALKASILYTDQMLEQAINQVRSISHELTPSVLEHFGLEVAFKEICVAFNTSDLEFQCLVFNLSSQLEKHLQVGVYRIAQELANNIVKHAGATEASLLLRQHKNSLVLLAEDNGKGFDPSHIQTKGIGLKSIQDRVKLLNGTMRIHAVPGQGTLVHISLPLGS